MAYTPTDWTDGVTPVNAALMDKIEQGIDQAHDAIANLTSVEYEGTYNPATPYQPGDVVVYNGVEYLAVNPSTGSTPPPAVQTPPTVLTQGIGYGTSLPVSPVNGEEYILVDSTTNPLYQWRFRWNAGSSRAHKWEFVGGIPLLIYPASYTPPAVNDYIIDTAAGATITVPRAGDYLCESNTELNGSTGNPLYMGFSFDFSRRIGAMGGAAGNIYARQWWPLAAGGVVRNCFYCATLLATFSNRMLSVLPLRVS